MYRNFKPENLLVGRGKKSNIFYMIDFAKSKRYICPKVGTHIAFKKTDKLIELGDEMFTPMREQQGKESGRREDLEGLGLLMCHFLKGKKKFAWEVESPDFHPISNVDPNAFNKRIARL